jgi:hypothetical protein
MLISAAKRITSGEELKLQNGLDRGAGELRDISTREKGSARVTT